MERKSLMDGIQESPKTSKGPKGNAKNYGGGTTGGDNNTLKLSIAVGLLVIAVGVIAVYEGWIPTAFTKEEKPPPAPAEAVKAAEQRQQQVQQQATQPAHPVQVGAN